MQVERARTFIGRFNCGDDLLAVLTRFCVVHDITLGVFSVIGAVTSAKMGYYDQHQQKYVECVSLEKKLEITVCTGNISLKGSDISVHAHITLADWNGQCYGGHLMPGTNVFAAEYYLQELTGGNVSRIYDTVTGLLLWPTESF